MTHESHREPTAPARRQGRMRSVASRWLSVTLGNTRQVPGSVIGNHLGDGQFTLCCLTVIAALLPHASWLPLPFLLTLLALIALRWWQRRLRPKPWSWLSRTLLMTALMVAAWTSIGSISGTQGAGFLAAMLVSKLFEAERVRDARSVATFASFLVMAHFLFHNQLWSMLAGLPGMVLALALLASVSQVLPMDWRGWLRPLSTASLLLAVSAPIALLAFAVFPRLDGPLWGNAGDFRRGEMGLSDRMEPGQIGSAAMDDRVAMRVRFENGVPAAGDRYFRGLTLWNTDGRIWTRPPWIDSQATEQAPVPDFGFRHEITLERDAAPWLPALDRPIAAPDGLPLALDQSLPIRLRNRQELRYQVTSNPALALEPFELRPTLRALALSLPEGRNPRTHALAQRLRAEHPDDRQYAQRLLRVFTTEFGYSLEPPPLGAHSVDEFLFDTLSGYCEHYASAYATLLRAGGVPARVVLGYQGGYWNAVGGHLVVRRADAHAWVEYWLHGEGWLRADPTSMVAPERIERGTDALADFNLGFRRNSSAWNWVRDRWDFLELRWTDWIVNYRVGNRAVLLQGALERLSTWSGRLPVFWLGLAGVLAFALGWWWRRRGSAVSNSDPAARWYTAFRRVLAGAGVSSNGAETPAGLVRRAGERFPESAPRLNALVSRYLVSRYADPADPPALPTRWELTRLGWRLRGQRLRRSLAGERR